MTDRERAEQLVDALDALAREHDCYEYGLSRSPHNKAQYIDLVIAFERTVKARVWEEAADYHEKLLALCGHDEWRERIRHEEEVKYFRQRAAALREGRDDGSL